MPTSRLKTKPHRIAFRVDAIERETIAGLAAACGLPVSEYIRRAALGQTLRPLPLIPEVNRKTYSELAHMGRNINQIAKALNEGLAAESGAQRIAQALPGLVKLLRTTQGLLTLPAADDEEAA